MMIIYFFKLYTLLFVARCSLVQFGVSFPCILKAFYDLHVYVFVYLVVSCFTLLYIVLSWLVDFLLISWRDHHRGSTPTRGGYAATLQEGVSGSNIRKEVKAIYIGGISLFTVPLVPYTDSVIILSFLCYPIILFG